MPIRIPLKSDIDVQDAFRDVENELSEIDILKAEIEKLKIALRDSDDRLISLETPHTATYNVLPDTVIQGNLNVAGNLGVTGAVNAPGQIGGYVESVTPGTAGTSLAQPLVEVHGALKVLSGLRADAAYLRYLNVQGSQLSRRLHTDTTDVGNVGAGEDNLMTYTLRGGTMAFNGEAIRVTAWGRWGANNNEKLLRAYFGSTSILLTVAGHIPNAGGWKAQFEIVRTGATSQILIGHNTTREGVGSSFNFVPDEATPAETLAGPVVIKMTGAATSDNDIVQKGMIVEYLS